MGRDQEPPTEAERQLEDSRLAALRSYGDISTLSDSALDALVRVAASCCEVPIALVSLVDDSRQCFIANLGLAAVSETSRDVAFFAHAITARELLVVPDATRDDRFAENPLVTGDPNIRFYAGMPLIDPDGYALGTLCVIDRVPRVLTPTQTRALADLATAVTRTLVAHRLSRALEVASQDAAAARADLGQILAATPTMFAYWNADLTNRFANAAYLRFFSRDGQSIHGLHIREVFGEELFAQNAPLLQAALRGETLPFERTRLEANGRRHVATGEYRPDVSDGVVRGVIVTLTDVTELHDALAESERRNELLTLAADVANIGHFELDLATQRLVWSPRVFAIHGQDIATFLPDPASAMDLYHPEDRVRVEALVQGAIEGGQPFDFESRIVRPTGELRRVHVRGVCEVDAATRVTRVVFGVVQDVTERESLRERVLRQERLVTTGTLAAGVGHEINNPLTFVMANLQFALDEIGAIGGPSPSRRIRDLVELLEEARAGAERIRKIVRGLSSFVRQETRVAEVDVPDAIEMSLNIAMHEVRHRATIKKDFGSVPSVVTEEAQLSQVIVNLVVNAAQAFATVDPKNEICIRTRTSPTGDAVIEVIDNGPGVMSKIASQIFDPFFTTKAPGYGTGLGLAISHSIVARLGGELVLEATPGGGATFRIVLPPGLEPSAPVRDVMELPKGASQRGRVLIVDDEPTLLRGIARLLAADHDVVSLGDSREALQVLTDNGESFDVIFSDILMPYVTGIELYRAIAARTPEVAERFVFMTGDVVREDIRTFLAEVSNERLEKPFSSQNLRGIAHRFAMIAAARRDPSSLSGQR